MKATELPGLEQETDQPRSTTTAWQRYESIEQPQREAPGGRLQARLCSHPDWTMAASLNVAESESVMPSPEEPQPASAASRARIAIGVASRISPATYPSASSAISSWGIPPQIGHSGSGVTASRLTSIVRRS